MRQADAVAVLVNGSNWPWHETAAAIGANVLECGVSAIGAESALVAADARDG